MDRVPAWPRLLGLAGILPQAAALAAVVLGPEYCQPTVLATAAIYAGLIFTFLGGMWWGMAASAPAAEGRGALGWVWIAAVAPSLLAFGALGWLAHGAPGGGAQPLVPVLTMLGGGILLSPLVDTQLARDANGGGLRIAPPWWLRLRWPLSILLGGLTLAIALG